MPEDSYRYICLPLEETVFIKQKNNSFSLPRRYHVQLYFFNVDFEFVNTLQKNFLTITIQNKHWPSFCIYVLYMCQCFIT